MGLTTDYEILRLAQVSLVVALVEYKMPGESRAGAVEEAGENLRSNDPNKYTAPPFSFRIPVVERRSVFYCTDKKISNKDKPLKVRNKLFIVLLFGIFF